MNNYPENLKIDNPRNLKLGIKSSFSKIKSPLALIYFLWKSNGRPFEILFSKEVKENNDTIKIEISDAIKKKLYLYLESKNFSGFSEEKLNKNLLFKAQIESLVVVFELIYKLASFSFQNTSYAFSEERTGKSRYNKIIRYTSNIDLFENFIEEDINFYEKLLFEWLLEENTKNPKEKRIIDFLTIISDDSIFKTIDFDGNEIKFSMAEIYKGLVKNNFINFKNSKENTGSLRILPNLLKEKLNSYIDIKSNNLVKKSDVEPEALDNYANRVSEGFKLKNLDLKDFYNSESFRTTSIIKHSEIDKPHQRIFFGAPGTGKSYLLNEDAKKYFGNNYERVTFHPNYMYGNFIGTFKPFPDKSEDGKETKTIMYKYIPGVLLRLLIKAIKNPVNYLLIIEEINRANTAAVFGDFFQLLDRNGNGESEYGIAVSEDLKLYLEKEFDKNNLTKNEKRYLGENLDKITLPPNFYIWATMNSADQGVMPLDTAFKRRWEFEYTGIDDAYNKSKDESGKSEFDDYKFRANRKELSNWNDFRIKINEILSKCHVSEDKLIGPYFISKSILASKDIDKITNAIKNKVLMYLYEDAGRQHRKRIFKEGKWETYSKLCEAFDENCEEIFNDKVELPDKTLIEVGEEIIRGTKEEEKIQENETEITENTESIDE